MKKKSYQLGFSLVEVLVASAVLGLLTLALLQQFTLQQKIMVTTEAGFDTIDAINQVRGVLSDAESCKTTFQNQTLSPTAVTPTNIMHAYKDASGALLYNVAFTTGVPINPNIQFTSFALTGANPTDGKATLAVEIERLKSGILGGAKVLRKIQMYVTTDASNKIQTCYAAGGNGGSGPDYSSLRPAASPPIHRSWLALPWNDPNSGNSWSNVPPTRSGLITVCAAPTTVLTRVIPAPSYDRIIQADASIFTIRDSGPEDIMLGEMDFNTTYTERTTVSVDGWGSDTMRLTGIYQQNAGTSVTITITVRNVQGVCNKIDRDRIHLFLKEL